MGGAANRTGRGTGESINEADGPETPEGSSTSTLHQEDR